MSTTIRNDDLAQRVNRHADKKRPHHQKLTVASNIPFRRLPEHTTLVADQHVIDKVAKIVWLRIVWGSASERADAIHKVLAIIDSPLHNLIETLTIAVVFKAIYNCFLERKRTAKLGEEFKKLAVERILGNMCIAWKLPGPKGTLAKRPEKGNRKDENTIGGPTAPLLRLHSILFADMFVVGLIDYETFLNILWQIIDNYKNGPRMETIIFGVICRGSAKGHLAIPEALWRKVVDEEDPGTDGNGLVQQFALDATQKEAVNRFVKNLRAKNPTRNLRKTALRVGLRDLLNEKCRTMQDQIGRLDRDA